MRNVEEVAKIAAGSYGYEGVASVIASFRNSLTGNIYGLKFKSKLLDDSYIGVETLYGVMFKAVATHNMSLLYEKLGIRTSLR